MSMDGIVGVKHQKHILATTGRRAMLSAVVLPDSREG